MKTLFSLLCLLVLLVGPSFAETGYISDVLVVTVRAQPGKGQAVLTTAKTGESLEVIEDLKDFMRVRTKNGIEGYIRSQYVTKEIPKYLQIKQLKAAMAKLQQQNEQLTTNLNQSDIQTASLSTTEKELARVKTEYQTLQKASANVLQTTHERDQLQQENSDLINSLQQLKEENNLYLRTSVIKWFLAGAGVLLLGWVLGKISRKKKRNFI